jgi:hypothetical protein
MIKSKVRNRNGASIGGVREFKTLSGRSRGDLDLIW